MKIFAKLLLVIVCIRLLLGFTKDEKIYAEDSSVIKSTHVLVNSSSTLIDEDRYVTMKDIDLKVHYRIIGNGPIDVVFIPGWTNPLEVYTKQFDYFRDKARCIYIDLPGTGLSDAPTPNTPLASIPGGIEYTKELMADAVYAIIKKEDLHQFVGVGFSMGPSILGMFERQYPGMIYKLVVIDGGFNPWPTEELARQNFIDAREATYLAMLNWTTAMKEAMGAGLIPPELEGENAEQLKEWGTYFSQFPSDILANTAYHGGAENANVTVGWTYPKLCFYQNPNPNMNKVNLIFPNNTVYSFPGGGHVIHWIFHKEINPLIWDFIKD